MRTVRSFIPIALSLSQELLLPELITHHLVRVLRLQKGDRFHLFNGDGFDYVGELLSLEKRGSQAIIRERIAVDTESPVHIHVMQSLARGEKMDWILQKATELGVREFSTLISERTEVKLDSERSDKKLAHWQGVIQAACEQSGRAFVPAIHAPMALNQLPPAQQSHSRFYLEPSASTPLNDLSISLKQPITIAIGPEGGFSERDIQLLKAAGFIGIRMGPRILRTETAGIACIAAIQARFGDW